MISMSPDLFCSDLGTFLLATAWGKNEVFVGCIRRDPPVKFGLNFWCVAGNLRKGAATNAVQIAELLIEKGFLPKE